MGWGSARWFREGKERRVEWQTFLRGFYEFFIFVGVGKHRRLSCHGQNGSGGWTSNPGHIDGRRGISHQSSSPTLKEINKEKKLQSQLLTAQMYLSGTDQVITKEYYGGNPLIVIAVSIRWPYITCIHTNESPHRKQYRTASASWIHIVNSRSQTLGFRTLQHSSSF